MTDWLTNSKRIGVEGRASILHLGGVPRAVSHGVRLRKSSALRDATGLKQLAAMYGSPADPALELAHGMLVDTET
jgi:hypothetical protein